MPAAIVQALEVVQVDVHQRARELLAVQPVDPAVHLFDEGAAVQQPGERVGTGLAGQLALDRLMLEAGPPAARQTHSPVRSPNRV